MILIIKFIKLQKLFAQTCIKLGDELKALECYKYVLFFGPKDLEAATEVKRLEVNIIQHIPAKLALYPNYPNPFYSKTVIKYDLPKDTHVNIQIYNIRGQLVKELVNGVEAAGRKQIEWNAKGLSSGIYFFKLSTKDKTFIKKMILMR